MKGAIFPFLKHISDNDLCSGTLLPSGAKAPVSWVDTARLKPRPFKTESRPEVLCSRVLFAIVVLAVVLCFSGNTQLWAQAQQTSQQAWQQIPIQK